MDWENEFRQLFSSFSGILLSLKYNFSKSALDSTCKMNLIKGIKCFNLLETTGLSTTNRIKEIINNLEIFPCLNIISCKDYTLVYDLVDCPCRNVLKYSYSISIKKLMITNPVSGIFVPFSPTIKISTCTFFWHSESLGICYCPEIRSTFSPRFELPLTLKDYVKHFLNDDNIQTSCMILLGRKHDFSVLVKFVSWLSTCFPDSKIPIWGGIVSEIVVCNTINNEHFCRVPVNLTCFFISSETLKAWSIIWPKKNQTEELIKQKLINFKQGLNLKNYSLGLIFLSRHELFNDDLELRIFTDVFPGIPYYCTISDFAFAGEKIKDIKNIFVRQKSPGKNLPSVTNNENTAIMIITF